MRRSLFVLMISESSFFWEQEVTRSGKALVVHGQTAIVTLQLCYSRICKLKFICFYFFIYLFIFFLIETPVDYNFYIFQEYEETCLFT